MESMEINKCVICFKNAEEDVHIHVPVNEASNIIGKCSVHLHSAINDDVFVNNLLAYQNTVQFCKQCFEHTAQLTELSDQLGTLKKKLLDVSITASLDILNRRHQLEHAKEENDPFDSRISLNTNIYSEQCGNESEDNNWSFVITDTRSINEESGIEQIMPYLDVLLDETPNTDECDHPIKEEENCPQTQTEQDVDHTIFDINKATQIPTQFNDVIQRNSMINKGLSTTPNNSNESNEIVTERFIEKNSNAGFDECDVQDNSTSSEDHSSSLSEGEVTITTTQDVAAILGLQSAINKKNSRIKVNVFKCKDCHNRVFVSKDEWEIHKQVHATADCKRHHKCSVCKKSYLSEWQLRAHERIHTGAEPYKCSICDKTFNQQTMLKNHKRLHTEAKPYKCSHCHWSFTQPKGLRAHQTVHTGERPYKCHYCEEKFKCRSGRSKHQRKKHSLNILHRNAQISKTKHPVYSPSKSELPLKTRIDLQAQKMSQTGNQPVCEKTTNTNAIDDLNKQNKSSVEKAPYNCGLCNRGFMKETHLIFHERFHFGDKPFKCLFCSKAYTFEGNRYKHQRLVHGKQS